MREIFEHMWSCIFNSRINVFCDVLCGLVDRIDVKKERAVSVFRVK
jgi:hypothetical protein